MLQARAMMMVRKNSRLLAIIIGGVFLMSYMYTVVANRQRRRTLKKNEEAIVVFLRLYATSQADYKSKKGEYATNLTKLSEYDSFFKDMNAARTPYAGYRFQILPTEANRMPSLVAFPITEFSDVCSTFVVTSSGEIWSKYIGSDAEEAVKELSLDDVTATWTMVAGGMGGRDE